MLHKANSPGALLAGVRAEKSSISHDSLCPAFFIPQLPVIFTLGTAFKMWKISEGQCSTTQL
jgi:hypothetical protein